AGEAKETGGERNEKEDDGPLDHERSPASRVISVPRTAFDNDRDDRVDRVFFGGLFRSEHRTLEVMNLAEIVVISAPRGTTQVSNRLSAHSYTMCVQWRLR